MKKYLATAAVVAVAGSAIIGTTSMAHAASATTVAAGSTTSSDSKSKHHDGRIHRAREHGALAQAVRDGVITDAQKTAFLTEVKSLHAQNKPTDPKSQTKEQRDARHATFKSEIQKWATDNSFPLSKIFPKLAQ